MCYIRVYYNLLSKPISWKKMKMLAVLGVLLIETFSEWCRIAEEIAWECKFGAVDDYVFECKGVVAYFSRWTGFLSD